MLAARVPRLSNDHGLLGPVSSTNEHYFHGGEATSLISALALILTAFYVKHNSRSGCHKYLLYLRRGEERKE